MFYQLVDDLERHGGHVRSHSRGLYDVDGVAYARRQHLSFPAIISVDLNYLRQQFESVLAYVIETSDKRADVGGSRLGSQDRLRRREAERYIYFGPLVR